MSLQPALLGGLFIGVLSALPIVSLANCCCLWIMGGGMLAAYLEQQNTPHAITAGRGAVAGLLAGAIGAVVWLMVSTVVDVVLAPLQERMLAEFVRNARDMPPEARVWLESMMTGDASPVRYVVGFGLMLFIGSAFAAAGGALGAVFFKKGVPPALGGPIQPPPQ